MLAGGASRRQARSGTRRGPGIRTLSESVAPLGLGRGKRARCRRRLEIQVLRVSARCGGADLSAAAAATPGHGSRSPDLVDSGSRFTVAVPPSRFPSFCPLSTAVSIAFAHLSSPSLRLSWGPAGGPGPGPGGPSDDAWILVLWPPGPGLGPCSDLGSGPTPLIPGLPQCPSAGPIPP